MMRDIDLLLINCNLIDGTGSQINKDICIGIKDKRIAFIENGAMKNVDSAKCSILNLKGATILPGFINAHAHTGYKYIKNKLCQGFQKEYLEACLREGVTTIRDEGMLSNNSIEEMLKQKNLMDCTEAYTNLVVTGKFFSYSRWLWWSSTNYGRN